MVAKIPCQRLNCYLFVVYRSPSTDDRVFDCLCETMGSIQSVDPKVFCFVAACGVLDHVQTNVPDLCNVNVQGNVGR